MKKLLAAITVIVLLGIIAVPYINGLIMEKTLKDFFAEANSLSSQTGSNYTLEILNYHRSIFSSDIDWRLDLSSLKNVYGIDEIIFSDHARHGYTGVVSTTRLDKNPWFTSFIEEKLGGENPFNIQTAYSFFGDITSRVDMAAFTTMAEQQEISVGEGQFIIETDDHLQDFSASASWLGLDAGEQASVADVSMETEMSQVSSFLWDGSIAFSVGTLRAAPPQGQLVVNNGRLTYSLETDMADDLADTEAAFSVDSIVSAGKTIDGARGALAVHNMSASGYENLLRSYTRMTAEIVDNIQTLEDPSADAGTVLQEKMGELTFQLIAALEKLLRKDLEIHLSDILVRTEEGDISGDIRLHLLKDMTLMQFAPIVGQPALALDIFSLESSARLPEVLVDDPSLLLTPLHPGMKTGLFISENGSLTHSAETREKELYLNGHQVELGAGTR